MAECEYLLNSLTANFKTETFFPYPIRVVIKMDVDDDNDSMTTEQKAANLAFLRKAIEDMESKDEMVDFSDEWYAQCVAFFWDIRKHFPDFSTILNPLETEEVEHAKLAAEGAAAQLEYEMDIGGSLDVDAFWRFCGAVEAIYQGTTDEEETGLEDMMMSVTIPTSIK